MPAALNRTPSAQGIAAGTDLWGMQSNAPESAPAAPQAIRIAWWTAFVATLVVVLGLSFVHTASAATSPISPQPRLFEIDLEEEGEEEAEDEGEELEFGECEFEEWEEEGEEAEEEVLDCEEEAEEDDSTPPQCRLESADAAVSIDRAHRKLHLALRYTAGSSGAVAIKYFLRGSHGPLTLPRERPRLRRAGVYRTASQLTPAQLKKAAAARNFTIQVRPAGAPGYCDDYLDQSLTVRRGGHGGPMWIDTDSTFRHARHA